jgi:anti-sigma B factor antagonist
MTEVAVVAKDSYPVQWVGRQAVVILPEHIDVSNASQIREELLTVINRGAAALIVDMTATLSCDHAGADAVVRAYPRALASGTQLRLVVTAHIVRRVLSLNGLDRLIPIYPSLEAAIAAGAPGGGPVVAGPGNTKTDGQAPPRPGARRRQPQRAAGPRNEPRAAGHRPVGAADAC